MVIVYSEKIFKTLPAFLLFPNFNIIKNCIFFYFSFKQHSFKCSKMKKIIPVLTIMIFRHFYVPDENL